MMICPELSMIYLRKNLIMFLIILMYWISSSLLMSSSLINFGQPFFFVSSILFPCRWQISCTLVSYREEFGATLGLLNHIQRLFRKVSFLSSDTNLEFHPSLPSLTRWVLVLCPFILLPCVLPIKTH